MPSNNQPIIILGAGITGLTTAYWLQKAGKDFVVFDVRNRTGGVIHTQKEEGFIYESGPNSGVLSNTEVMQLFNSLANKVRLEKASTISKDRWILKDGRWYSLPSGIVEGIKTPLFTWKDKFQLLGEPFRQKGNNPNENLADMVKRRMGKSYLDYAVDPFVIGIYAGDPQLLIPKYALPKLYELEQEYGSFIKGAIKKAKIPKTDLEKQTDRSIFSTKGGLSELIQALETSIGKEHIILDVKNTSLHVLKNKKTFEFSYQKDNITHKIKSNHVVSTFGGHALKQLLQLEDKSHIDCICQMPQADVVSVAVGFKHWEGINIKSFGGLIPYKEHEDVLGILFMSSIFKHRAPTQGAMFNLFIGGVRKAELLTLEDSQLIRILESFFINKMGLKTFKPDIFKLKRIKQAIPQYTIASQARLESITYLEQKYPGLHLAGNIRDGIGIADRIKQASKIAQKIISK